jgi:hypothetical protein
MPLDKIGFQYPREVLQSVFSKDEMTALELASKTAKKVDECVDIVNGVEQISIEATEIVNTMQQIQENYVQENADVRSQLLIANQTLLDEMEVTNEAFKDDVTANKNTFINETTLAKNAYEDSLTASKTSFENTMTTDLTTFTADVEATKTAYTNSVNASKTTFDTDMNNSLNTFKAEIATNKYDFLQQTNAILTGAEAQISNEVTETIGEMLVNGTIENLIDDEILLDIKDDIKKVGFKTGSYMEGMEYLYYYHDKIRTLQPVKVILSGDSTTAGNLLNNLDYQLHALVRSELHKAGVNNVTSINAGHDSKNVGNWIANYLSADLLMSPDLYVIRWGFNHDGAIPIATRLANFTNGLRSGLATIRASKTPQQLSLILMTPNSGNDVENGRDKEWFEMIQPVIKQAARDFQCCFIDTYNYLLDSTNAIWQDTPMPDPTVHIHPLETANVWIVSLMLEAIIPTVLRKYGVINYSSSERNIIGDVSKPSEFSYGVSFDRSLYNYPFNGQVTTLKQRDGVTLQINTSLYLADSKKFAFRLGNQTTGIPSSIGNDAFGEWVIIGGSEAWTPLTLSGTWVHSGGATDSVNQYRKDANGEVYIEGLIKNGAITVGSAIADALPLGYRPLKDKILPVSSNGSYGLVKISSNGVLSCLSVSSATWLCLDGIHFKAEQ